MAVYVTPSNSFGALSFTSNATCVDGISTAGTFNPTFIAACVRVSGTAGVDYIQTMPFIGGVAPTTVFFHVDMYLSPSNAGANVPLLTWVNSVGTPVLRISSGLGNTAKFEFWNGTVFTTVGSPFAFTPNILYAADIKLVCGAAGSVELRFGNSVVASGSGLNAAVTDIAAMRLSNWNSTLGNFCYYSQVSAADFDLADYRGHEAVLNALGSFYTGGTGAITAVQKTALNDTTFWSFAAAGGRGATSTALTNPGGYFVFAAYLNGRIRGTGGVPNNALFGFRNAAVDNTTPLVNPGTSFAPRGGFVQLFNGAPITYATFNSSEKFVLAS